MRAVVAWLVARLLQALGVRDSVPPRGLFDLTKPKRGRGQLVFINLQSELGSLGKKGEGQGNWGF